MVSKSSLCELGFARLDLDRKRRRGFAEVIYAPGKTRAALTRIALELIRNKQDLLITRLEKAQFVFLKKSFPRLKYNPLAKIGYLLYGKRKAAQGPVLVVSGGTADIPVAEEAAVTAQILGSTVIKLYDVGVAGVHRLMSNMQLIRKAKIIIVVAGMEGALASLVSGLAGCPVIAVPTSCGYGANFAGLSALLTMLNSCSPGVAVVNIDNGFGAGYFAATINNSNVGA